MAVDQGLNTTDEATRTMPPSYDGAIGFTGSRINEHRQGLPEPAVDAACAERFAAKAGSRPERGTTAYGGTMAVCAVTDLFAAVARAAGADLTRRGFVDAAGSVGPLELPYGGPASLAPGKPDAADAMRPLVWTARCTCWLPVGGYVRVP